MAEFDLGDCGTVMLKKEDIYYAIPFGTMGWVFTCKEGLISFKGEESHMETVQGLHKFLINGSSHLQLLLSKQL